MNLLIIISSLNYGGAEKQAVIDANLFSQEHTVSVISFKDGPLRDFLQPKVRYTHLEKQIYPYTAWRIAKICRQNDIQVIHAHLFAPMAIAALSSLFTGVPIIWNFHAHSYEEHYGRLLISFLSKLPQTRKIIFPVKELLNYYRMEKYSFPKKKEVVVTNCSEFSGCEKGRTNNKFQIGYIGRVIELKRLEYLIYLAEELHKSNDGFKITIVGDGDQLDAIKNLAKDRGVNKYFQFPGFQPNPADYYAVFDLFILPSREEVQSLALIDAGIAKIPSVAFNAGGNNDIVVNGHTGYIVQDFTEMAEKVIMLMKNPDLCKNMGKEAYNYCIKKFHPDVRKQMLLQLYTEELSN